MDNMNACQRRGQNLFPSFVLFLTSILLTNSVNQVLASENAKTEVYIVYLGQRMHNDVELITSGHHDILASILGSKQASVNSMIYSYRHGFSGFAAKLTKSQAKRVAALPGVVHVLPHAFYKVQTTRSWDYLGLSPNFKTNLLHDAKMGDDAIIGVFDTGIWPESPSFNDKGFGPIPSRWKGFCQSGDKFDPAKHCNKKLIGARYFVDGFLAAGGGELLKRVDNDFLSARDSTGHGTHCTSIACGSFVNNVSQGGLALGTVRGGAPKARVAMYKVAWLGAGVSSADILKAFDEAIHDGVDVLSISITFGLPLYPEVDKRDVIYYGSFHATMSGITVVCSAGNGGPGAGTVSDVAPWVITVAANTIDRSFPTAIILGNNQKFKGQSMYVGKDTGFVPLFYRDRVELQSQLRCDDIRASNDTWAAGKVVLCFTRAGLEGTIPIAQDAVLRASGLGLIVAGPNFQSLSLYYGTVPLPDISAPGVDILAATVEDNTGVYRFESGTSMAAPHIAGMAALLKSLHPNWSPAAIKSALVTTAWTIDPHSGEPIYAIGDVNRIANPFDYGGGVANPNGAKSPGLVYDIRTQDYTSYLCAMGYNETSIKQLTGKNSPCHDGAVDQSILHLNLPSITIPSLKGSIAIKRSVTNVGNPNSKYKVIIDPPYGTVVDVKPKYLLFNPKVRMMTYTVTISRFHNITTEYYYGSLTWVDGWHTIRIPISVRTDFPDI